MLYSEKKNCCQRESQSLSISVLCLSSLLHQLADEISRSDPQNASKAEPYYKEAAESCPENTMVGVVCLVHSYLCLVSRVASTLVHVLWSIRRM